MNQKHIFIHEDYKSKTREAKIMRVKDESFWEDWWKKVFPEVKDGEFVYSWRLYEKGHSFYEQFDRWINGILCLEGGLSRDGISYYLIIPKANKVSKEDIKKTKAHLRYLYDITQFYVFPVNLHTAKDCLETTTRETIEGGSNE